MRNEVLNQAAKISFPSVPLNFSSPCEKHKFNDSSVRKALKDLRLAKDSLTTKESVHYLNSQHVFDAKLKVCELRNKLRSQIRSFYRKESIKRDNKMHSILSSNPMKLYKAMRESKSVKSSSTPHELKVGEDTYIGASVPDGSFYALASLKTQDLSSNPHYSELSVLYSHVLEIAYEGSPIPSISLTDAHKILKSLKSHVSDINSISLPRSWNHWY